MGRSRVSWLMVFSKCCFLLLLVMLFAGADISTAMMDTLGSEEEMLEKIRMAVGDQN